jgi:hypothetical protein
MLEQGPVATGGNFESFGPAASAGLSPTHLNTPNTLSPLPGHGHGETIVMAMVMAKPSTWQGH